MAAKTTGTRQVERRPKLVTTKPKETRSNTSEDRVPNLPDWRWRSFPVLAAFIAGVLLDSIINPPASDAAVVLRVVAVLGAGYCLAHLFIVNTIVARRIKARQKTIDAGSDGDEWVDEVVHPGEDTASTTDQPQSEAHLTQ